MVEGCALLAASFYLASSHDNKDAIVAKFDAIVAKFDAIAESNAIANVSHVSSHQEQEPCNVIKSPLPILQEIPALPQENVVVDVIESIHQASGTLPSFVTKATTTAAPPAENRHFPSGSTPFHQTIHVASSVLLALDHPVEPPVDPLPCPQ